MASELEGMLEMSACRGIPLDILKSVDALERFWGLAATSEASGKCGQKSLCYGGRAVITGQSIIKICSTMNWVSTPTEIRSHDQNLIPTHDK